MNNLSSNLKNKVELWDRVAIKNELNEDDLQDTEIKTMFIDIMPIKLLGNNTTTTVGTIPAETTHRAKCRKKSITNINNNMFFIYQDKRYDFLYSQPDFEWDEYWEIMLKVKTE